MFLKVWFCNCVFAIEVLRIVVLLIVFYNYDFAATLATPPHCKTNPRSPKRCNKKAQDVLTDAKAQEVLTDEKPKKS